MISLLADNKTLTCLDLRDVRIDDAGVTVLACNITLDTLRLGHCNIGLEEAKALAENTTLKTLELYGSWLDSAAISQLAESPTLRFLRLNNCKGIGNPEIICLAGSETLETLWLRLESNIDHAAMLALANNKTLKWLSLSYTGNHPLVDAFARNTTLERLSLENVSDDDIRILACNQTLIELIITNNKTHRITNINGAVEALLSNQTLMRLLVDGVRPFEYGSDLPRVKGERRSPLVKYIIIAI